jgi:hypothetical protein
LAIDWSREKHTVGFFNITGRSQSMAQSQSQGSANDTSNTVEVVRFVGPQHERSFTKSDLKNYDPEFDGKGVSFNADNGFAVPVNKLSKTVVDALVADGDFVVEDPGKVNSVVADKSVIAETRERGNAAFTTSGTGFRGTGTTASARTPATIGDAT